MTAAYPFGSLEYLGCKDIDCNEDFSKEEMKATCNLHQIITLSTTRPPTNMST